MNDKLNNFRFSFEMAAKAKEDIQEQLSAIDERIYKIVDHFTINDVPILKYILNMDPSKDELKKLSKAIDRLADLVDVHSSLSAKLAVVSTAEKDPNWFALAFGDFESDIDSGLEQLFNKD
jgi:archaellum component FlaC